MSEIRVRFAPSPTGHLHVGGARTALFNWLFARNQRGKFLLRIEDTDRERSTPEAVKAIFEALQWLGLDWDEEPIFQSDRINEHRNLVSKLLENGAADHCFCDPEKLGNKDGGSEHTEQKYGYPGTCRNLEIDEINEKLNAGQDFAVRFRIPPGITSFKDIVHGAIEVDNSELEDFVVQRRDGTPVYQVAVVGDDASMGITHVIRGDDHISNTPKQILLYLALGLPIPKFAHVPLILGADGKRLSKRHGATSTTEYRERGILPEAMRNFLALLGWSPGEDRELMTLDEMTKYFSLERVTPKGAVFDETKLQWMNGKYISTLPNEDIWIKIKPYIAEFCRDNRVPIPDKDYGTRLVNLFGERLQAFKDAPDLMSYFFIDPTDWDEKGIEKHWKSDTPEHLSVLLDELKQIDNWGEDRLESSFNQVAERLAIKRGRLIHPARLALTGRSASPGIFAIIEILGKEICLKRLEDGIAGRGLTGR